MKIKKIALLTAMAMCLTLTSRSMTPVKAAEVSVQCTDGCDCTEVSHKTSEITRKITKTCEQPGHVSLSCKVTVYYSQDYSIIECSKCGKQISKMPIGNEYVSGENHNFLY